MIQQGWHFTNDSDFKPYLRRKDELSVYDGCILWGSRVVVPPPGRVKVTQLHEGHPGVNRMKALACSFVWWPQLDSDLESLVQSCEECQRFQHLPPVTPLQPWEWPQRPWARVHIDYAGSFFGQNFSIVADAHSKLKLCQILHQQSPLNICIPFFSHMVLQRCWCPLMDPYLLVLNSPILSKAVVSGVQILPHTIHPQMVWQRGQCRLSKLT